MISERLDGIKVEPPKQPALTWKDLGAKLLDGWEGACARASWYKAHDVPETDPPAVRYTRCQLLDEKVKELLLPGAKPFGWEVAIPGSTKTFTLRLDHVSEEGIGVVGCLLIPGGGIAFRNEVFGTSYKAGGIKTQDWVRVAMMLSSCPLELAAIEVIYVDRGMMDHVGYLVKKGEGPGKFSIESFLTLVSGTLPSPSYEKEWSDTERVAKLYADKRITKGVYEEFKKTGNGGDWNCRYCVHFKKCCDDDQVAR